MEREIFSKLAKGAIFQKVVEFETDFSVLRPLGWYDQKKKLRLVERLSLPKISPNEYFMSQAKEIPVWSNDPQIREEMMKKFPWIKILK